MVIAGKGMEFEGQDVADAIKKALKTLGVSRETITVKVLSEEQKGLFRMPGLKPAKIKVSLKVKPVGDGHTTSATKVRSKT
jgi:spoIIIJ-associated protein